MMILDRALSSARCGVALPKRLELNRKARIDHSPGPDQPHATRHQPHGAARATTASSDACPGAFHIQQGTPENSFVHAARTRADRLHHCTKCDFIQSVAPRDLHHEFTTMRARSGGRQSSHAMTLTWSADHQSIVSLRFDFHIQSLQAYLF
jgi:hypothetical protein